MSAEVPKKYYANLTKHEVTYTGIAEIVDKWTVRFKADHEQVHDGIYAGCIIMAYRPEVVLGGRVDLANSVASPLEAMMARNQYPETHAIFGKFQGKGRPAMVGTGSSRASGSDGILTKNRPPTIAQARHGSKRYPAVRPVDHEAQQGKETPHGHQPLPRPALQRTRIVNRLSSTRGSSAL